MPKTTATEAEKPTGFHFDSNITWGMVMIALGYSGAFADSSFALYLVGAGFLGWGVFCGFRGPSERQAASGKSRSADDGFRETVESLVVAFILAFLFRSFEAEAFVIPTGSMAPTLLGRHKDVECEKCGFGYRIGASQELNRENGRLVMRLERSRCPNCRFNNNVRELPPFPGDRIVVTKLYEEPDRFDVIVFKYPEEPQINYIKRCVGKPLETIKIEHGDLYRRVTETDEWEILRKPTPSKQQHIQLVVYDDRHPPRELLDAGWPERWTGAERSDDPGAIGGWRRTNSFEVDSGERAYTVSATDTVQWLRYRHLVPSQDDWQAVLSGEELGKARPWLISDFCGYNMAWPSASPPSDHGLYWVGDLTVEYSVDVSPSRNGKLVTELVEGDNLYRVVIETDTGTATLYRVWQGAETKLASQPTDCKGAGTFAIRFANVDERLILWVDGSPIDFGEAAMVPTSELRPGNDDLCPVGIGVSNAEAKISSIVLYRDIYYRDDVYNGADLPPIAEAPSLRLQTYLGQPEMWYDEYRRAVNERDRSLGKRPVYRLEANEYLMLGDNSPQSSDARLFSHVARHERGTPYKRYAVSGDAIIGKAFFVYWPHGVPFLNEGKGYSFPFSDHIDMDGNRVKDYPNHRLPFYPNIGRMRRIR